MKAGVFKNYLPIILIVILASFLRLFWLDKVPNAIGGDELTYVLNAKAIWLSGSDISGTWNPLTAFVFKYPAYTLPQAELPYFLLLPIVGPLPFSLFAARFPFALLSIFAVLLIYLISKELFGKEVGIVSALVAALNPWLIYIGRTSYEASPMVFFFLLSFLVLLKAKGRQILWSIPVLFLGFYSYIGTKLLFLPFVFIICIYCYFFLNKKKYLSNYLIVFFSCLFLVLFFLSTFFSLNSPSRLGEIISLNDPTIAKQVDEIRKVSINNSFTNIFENKFTIFSRIIITKLLKSFSADYLFTSGDNFYSIVRHGMFYVIDVFFILIGFAKIYEKKKPAFWLLLCLIFISTFPQLFHTAEIDNFVFHLSLMFPFFTIIIGVGVWEILNIFLKKSYFYASSAVVILLYGFLVFNFLNIYFFQWPLRGNFDFDLRVFSKYVSFSSQQKVDVYSQSASDIFKKYIFYTNSLNKNTLSQISLIFKSNKYNFKNISFKGCDNAINPAKTKNILIYDFSCGALKSDAKHLSISRLYDGGEDYSIYNDKVCSKFDLKPYPSDIKISDFSIENMSSEKFCQTYITNF